MRHRVILAICLLTALNNAPASDKQPEAKPRKVAASQPDASSATAHTFDIWELQVEGNTLLDRVLVERAVYPFLGQNKTVNDVEAARQALEIFYRDSGYATVVVDIPEQEVKAGHRAT